MKKTFLVITGTAIGLTSLHAQEKGQLKLGLGISSTAFIKSEDVYLKKVGPGLEAKGEYGITKNFSAFAQVGLSNFWGKKIKEGDVTFNPGSMQYIPILVGVNYVHKSGFMVGAGLGLTAYGGRGGGEAGFAYMIHTGYSFGKFDILADYTRTTANNGTSFGGLKLYYNIFKTSKR